MHVIENLRLLAHGPSVQIHDIPKDAIEENNIHSLTENINPDTRLPQTDLDRRIQCDNEYSDSEDEGEGGRRDNRTFEVYLYILFVFDTTKIIICSCSNIYYVHSCL